MIGRPPTPRPTESGLWFHLWTYKRAKRRNRLDLETARVVKTKATGQGPTAVYDETSYPAAWRTRAAANKYGLNRYGAGNFRVFECDGPSCPMAAHE